MLETAAKRASGPLAWWRARGELLRDTIGAVTYTIVALLPPMVSNGVALGEFPPPHPGGTPAVLLALAQTLPLALRRRAPVVALAVIGSAFAAYQCLNYGQSFTTTGIILALYATGAHQRRFRLTLLAAVSAAYLVVALVLAGLHSPERPVDYVTFYLFLLGCWGAGTLVRSRQRAEAELRVRTAADAAAAERTRIARELHDVVTHHVTAMVIQADAATFLAESAPARVPGELGEISATGRRALTELRYLLGLLDTVGQPGAPAFAAGRLRDLVEQTRRTGQPVELVTDGDPLPLADAAGLAAYRVVQEALTNALKHAPGHRTVVRVSYAARCVGIDVTTDGPGGLAPSRLAAGRGLSGLRDRLGQCGGSLEAGQLPEGGFRVRARVPALAASGVAGD